MQIPIDFNKIKLANKFDLWKESSEGIFIPKMLKFYSFGTNMIFESLVKNTNGQFWEKMTLLMLVTLFQAQPTEEKERRFDKNSLHSLRKRRKAFA